VNSYLLTLLILSLVVFALAASIYLPVLRRLFESGGQIDPTPLGAPDLAVCFAWAGVLSTAGLLAFSAEAKAISSEDVLFNSGFFTLLALAIVGLLIMRKVDVTTLVGVRKVPVPHALRAGLRILVAGYPTVLLMNLLSHSRTGDSINSQPIVVFFSHAVESGDYTSVALLIACAVFVAPVVEEFAFRGYLHATLKRHFGLAAAIVVNAAAFATVHGHVPALPGLFMLAILLTVGYEITGSILVPMVMHALFNFTSLTLVLASVLLDK
jgi:membrane protease YdiL (CAAX protease family)